MTKKYSIITASLFALFLNSCASKYSAAERAILSSVKIEQTSLADDAYHDPRGAARNSINENTQAAGGGLIGALIGEGIAATQNKLYNNKEKANFSKLKATTPKSLQPTVNAAVKRSLKNNPFFASKIKSQSPNRVLSKITSYSLTRTGKDANKNLRMSPYITAEIEIVGADGKAIGRGWTPITGTASMSNSTSNYLANPTLLKRGYEQAASDLASQLSSQLAARTAH